MLIDTHCHINDPDAFPDPGAAIDEAVSNGVHQLLVVGVEPQSWASALQLAEDRSEVKAIIGWHPNYTAEYRGLSSLRDTIARYRSHICALGEIGLDYHWDYSPPMQQHQALLEQLELAEELDLPVVFHCREAYPDLLDVLERREPRPYLFHCFAGDLEDARRAMALDSYFGVDGPITYKSAHALREVISTLSMDRIVVETDSPYMTPVPHRGKPNEPAYVRYVNAALAQLRGISEEECARLTTDNARRFFGI